MSVSLALYRRAASFGAAIGIPELVLGGKTEELFERTGRAPETFGERPLWIHAASLGETAAAASLVRALRGAARAPRIAFSATTRAGRERARTLAPDVGPFFVPLDVPRYVRRARERLRPAALVLLETELWPNLLLDLTAHGVPWAIASARLSGLAARRMRFVRGMYAQVLARASAIAARSEDDARRFLELGAPPEAVRVTGDLKESLEVPPYSAPPSDRFRWIAACTRPGEEEIVLEATAELARHERAGETWIAPRHAERFEEVARLLERRAFPWRRWEARDEAGPDGAWSIVLVDRLGVMGEAYRRTAGAFVGGSLLPFRGHSPLEAAAAGRPILLGPHTENCARAAETLVGSGAARRVNDAADLAREIAALVHDPHAAEERGRAAHALAARSSDADVRTVTFLRERGVIAR